jgi:hypothetical protein
VEEQETKSSESSADQPKPEGLLYHYTTQQGLLGIFKEQKIWASHLQYLNDKSEGQIFTKLLRDEFERLATKGPEEPPSQLTALERLMRLSVGYPESELQCAHKEVLDSGSHAFSWISGKTPLRPRFLNKETFSASGEPIQVRRAVTVSASHDHI